MVVCSALSDSSPGAQTGRREGVIGPCGRSAAVTRGAAELRCPNAWRHLATVQLIEDGGLAALSGTLQTAAEPATGRILALTRCIGSLHPRGGTITIQRAFDRTPSARTMPMRPDASVTQWIDRLKAGDPDAAQKLWERYFRRLVGLARKKLRAAPRRAADEEDVALSAFDSFCRGAEQDRFPQLHDRLDLWQLLVLLTARKAFDLAQHERRQKRGGGAVLDEAALPGPADSSAQEAALEQIEGPEPTPAFAAQVAEEYRRLLERLDSPELRNVALRKVEGYGNEEIAAQLGCGLRTVERRLRLIRSIWEQEGVS